MPEVLAEKALLQCAKLDGTSDLGQAKTPMNFTDHQAG